MRDLREIKRFVDVEKLSEEQLKNIQENLVKKVTEIVDKACEDANKLLNIYGLQAKMKFALEEVEK